MTAHSRTARGLLAFVLVCAMLTSPGAGRPAAAAPDDAPGRAPQANDLRISQVYGGGGNSGATYTHDFIELFNAGTSTLSLAGYSVQYTSATGTGTWQVTNLGGSIGPGQYYLVQQAQGAGGTTPLPTPDAVGTITMGGTAGKVALVNTTTALTGSGCPFAASIVDFVGYGATANCFEGSGPTPTLSNTTAALRAGNGCTDTDQNAADFSTGAPTPRNTASPTNSCGADVPPTVIDTTPDNGATNVPVDVIMDVTFSEPVVISGTVAIDCTSSGLENATPAGGPATFTLPHTDFDLGETCTVTILASQVTDLDGSPNNMVADYVWSFQMTNGCFAASTAIHDIQGSGLASPLVGQQHVVEAKVIADYQGVGNINGYFIQEPVDQQDADPATSEGLFVYDPALLVNVAVGDYVRVAGTVAEFQNQTQLTTLTAVTICPFQATATPVNVTLPFPSLNYPERFESMSVVMTQTLTVNETFNLGRGSILTLADGRLQQPTNVVLPGAPAIALQAANNLNMITLDDGSLVQNPDPIVYPPPALAALNTVRSGDSVSDIAGVFTQGNPGWTTPGNIYRINPFAMPTFTATNPRPAAPNPVRAGGSL
ncbi:MAG TPA: Ig-like domain-containing protein, partial [Anaerolineae bacterium]|nr:Ig-like domain-containing protein [Anaerolineae bacterium]